MVRTWAPKGQTPVLKAKASREHLSMISAITPDGRLYTRTLDHAFRTAAVIAFLRHLARMDGGKILVIWDGAPIHRSLALRDFLSMIGDSIRLERLPGYAPDLNPDELVWRQLKRDLGNVCCPDVDSLRAHLRSATTRLRSRPAKITNFFRHTFPLEN